MAAKTISRRELYSTKRRTATASARVEQNAMLNFDTEDALQVRVRTRWRTTAAPTSIELWSPALSEWTPSAIGWGKSHSKGQNVSQTEFRGTTQSRVVGSRDDADHGQSEKGREGREPPLSPAGAVDGQYDCTPS